MEENTRVNSLMENLVVEEQKSMHKAMRLMDTGLVENSSMVNPVKESSINKKNSLKRLN